MTEDELKQLSNADLERLADSIQAEIDRRWRKREKEAVKDAMNIERQIADYVIENPPEPHDTPFVRLHK